jgi:hypothetical protein
MRQISWIDQRIRFFMRRLVGLMLDGRHHGEGKHDQRDMPMPATLTAAACNLGRLPKLLENAA